MSKSKEQLAAVLINHWHVVSQMLGIGRKKRIPVSPRYKQIADLDFAQEAGVTECMNSFIAFNSKHFVENMRFVVDAKVESMPGIKMNWSPRVTVRGLTGVLCAESAEFNIASSLLSGMFFSRQNADVTAIMSGLQLVPAETGIGVNFLVPAFKTNPFSLLEVEEVALANDVGNKIAALNIIQKAVLEITERDKTEIINNRANVMVNIEVRDGVMHPLSFSIEETDGARAQRIAREHLEELRRRRTMMINSVELTDTLLSYNISPLIASDDNHLISVSVETLIGW
jgi:hypothetical protein